MRVRSMCLSGSCWKVLPGFAGRADVLILHEKHLHRVLRSYHLRMLQMRDQCRNQEHNHPFYELMC